MSVETTAGRRHALSGFVKRFVLSMVASKMQKLSHKRGGSPMMDGLMHEVNRRRGYGHQAPHHYAHHGHYRYHGHYKHHGHYRRRRW
jgi:hypothetical protein